MANDWVKEFPVSITVTDKDGRFIEMNDASLTTFAPEGGASLIGTEIMECHNENSKGIIREIIDSKNPNVYIVEKSGKRKLIYQAPYTVNGEYCGLVELSIILPEVLDVKKRD